MQHKKWLHSRQCICLHFRKSTVLLDNTPEAFSEVVSYFPQGLEDVKDIVFPCESIHIQYVDDYFLCSINLGNSKTDSLHPLT